MFPSNNDERFFDEPDEKKISSKQLYLNMVLCLAVIIAGILACNWIFSDISGVYMVNAAGGQSPVTLSLIRKPTTLEGELSIARAGYFYLVNSKMKDEKMHLEFRQKEEFEKKHKQIIFITIDGIYKDDKIDAVIQSSIGKKPQKIVLTREPVTSLHKILQAHMPFVSK